MARRGASRLRDGGPGDRGRGDSRASAAWRAAAGEPRRSGPRHPAGDTAPQGPGRQATGSGRSPTEPWQPEEWIDEGAVRDEAEGAVGRGRSGGGRPGPGATRAPGSGAAGRRRARGTAPAPAPATPPVGAGRGQAATGDIDAEVRKAVGAARAPRFEQRMREAVNAFRKGHDDEARRLLRPLAESAPQVATVRELYGLALYRLGRWKQAARELEAFRTLTASVEQHPVLADCYRALRRYRDVEELWQELRAASPSAALVAEGRIVAAGALADQGRVRDAIRLLEPAARPVRRAKEHHLRAAYALADLYERAGELPQARDLFRRIGAADPDFVDVQARLQALR